MENLIKDIRYALRTIVKRPGFSLIAIITLALGIGANTAIFSVVNGILWRPLPYPQPQQLVMAWTNHQARGGPAQEWFSPPEVDDWRAQNKVFSQLSALNNWVPTLTGRDEPESLVGAAVSYDMFNLLGIAPARGRTFLPDEDQLNGANVVVLSDDLWRKRFNSDPNIVGKSISLNQADYQVIGVMPAGFQFPIIPGVQVWRTLRPTLSPSCARGCIVLRAIGRMKDNVTIEQAQADVSTIASRLAAQYPDTNSKVGAALVPFQEQLVGNIKRPLLVLLGAVGFVLLIACANVANLMLARAATREREMALRSALGASRLRVIRQLLTESALLAFAGAAAGLALAYWLLRLLVRLSPQGTPGLDQIAIDRYVLGFTVLIAAFTGIVFGLAPALQMSKIDLNRSLKDTGKGTPGGARGGRLRGALVIAEMALALLLLIGSGLLMKSFILLQRVDPGFNPDHVVTLRLILNRTAYPAVPQVVNYYAQLLDRVKAVPGVQSAATISTLPLSGNQTDTNFLIEGRPAPPPNQEPSAWFNSVSNDYFQAMQLHMVKGRTFAESDNEKAPLVAIISEAMARKFWPNEDPLGKRIGRGPDKWREIVGVVRDVKHFGLDTDAPPTMYFPMRQQPARGMDLVVRTQGDPLSMAPTLRQQVWAGDRNLAIANLGTMKDLVSSSITQQKFILTLLACFAGLALLLAAVGIYGVMSYAVTQRTHEIGIRMALGARVADVLRLVFQQGLVLTLIGVAIGIALAFALTRLMKSLLFDVTPTDAMTFAIVAVALVLVALLACLVPARRATKVDPLIALRYE
ncbi:MAG TPA: ABC transporter permease [Pyrinomonadaceae bacterium]|nr:ABC transporter permease [Pyrinomonadaceae bacterium]